MRHPAILCLFVLIFTAGCPLIQPPTQFRSADLSAARSPIAFALEDSGSDAGGGVPREVVEPDIFRQRGNLLFALNQFRGLSIINMDTAELVGQSPVQGFPRDLYLTDTRAYVLTASATDFIVEGNSVEFSVSSRLAVVDISDPANPTLIGETPLLGDLMDSRLVGNILYAATAHYNYYFVDNEVSKSQVSGTTVTSFDLSSAQNIGAVDIVNFEGTGHVVHATNMAMFVGTFDYRDDETSLTYVDISAPDGTMSVADQAIVPGRVADRFKMDVFNGVLRVVSNSSRNTRETYVTTFDLADPDQLDQLGRTRLETASGDTLFAVRFAGNRAYVVTYLRVDPFYVIDLSDPANPIVAGELEVPGWSVHLEPIDDSTLLALGVDDTNGRDITLSLFDVSDAANPSLTDRKAIGSNWSWSLALSDVRAFSIMGDVAAVPISQWDSDGGYTSRVQLATFTTEGIQLRGFLEAHGTVLRTLDYAATYVTISDTEVSLFDKDLDTPELQESITLAENTTDVIPLGEGARLDITLDDTYTNVSVRRVEQNGDATGDTNIRLGSYMTGFPVEGGAVLIGAQYDDRAAYRVVRLECLPGQAPTVTQDIQVDLAPNWGYGYLPFLAETDKSLIADRYVPWGYFRQNTPAFLRSDSIVLRGWSDKFDQVIGAAIPYEGLAIISLSDFSVRTIGLGIEGVADVFQAGDALFATNKVFSSSSLDTLPTCAFFVRSLDIDNATASPPANVPGMPIAYDTANQILTLQDYQWNAFVNAIWSTPTAYLRTASWNGADTAVTAIGTVPLPASADMPTQSGEHVFVGSYPIDSGYQIHAWRIGADGAILERGSLIATSQWGYLLGADGAKVYSVIGGRLAARYDFTGSPSLDTVVDLGSYPSRLRLDANSAYIPAGYGGVTVIPR